MLGRCGEGTKSLTPGSISKNPTWTARLYMPPASMLSRGLLSQDGILNSAVLGAPRAMCTSHL